MIARLEAASANAIGTPHTSSSENSPMSRVSCIRARRLTAAPPSIRRNAAISATMSMPIGNASRTMNCGVCRTVSDTSPSR